MDSWSDFLSFYKSARHYHLATRYCFDNYQLKIENLNVKLRPYQEDAVKWMLHREAADSYGFTSDGIRVNYPRGGILADEMGLGKTVEVLALILNNPSTYKKPEPSEDDYNYHKYEALTSSGGRQSPNLVEDSVGFHFEDCSAEEVALEYCLNRPERRKNGGEYDSDASCASDCPAKKKKRNSPGKSSKCYDSDEDYVPPGPSSAKKTDVLKKKRKCKEVSKECDPGPSTSQRNSTKTDYCLVSNIKKKYKPGELKQTLTAWYESALGQMKPKTRKEECVEEVLIHCHCNKFHDEDLVRCETCSYLQHKQCVGLDEYFPRHYYCPTCWSKRPNIDTGATFIVSPDSIVHQWQDEIQRHISKTNLKVLYYYGARSGRYFQPEQLADQDIVITTYQSLSDELVYTSETEQRTLRHRKKYYSNRTPLTCVNWYRIVLDEAQMAESVKTKAAEMLKKFNVTIRWAVTGTPIQKSFSDLYGLMVFLGITPLNDIKIWDELMLDRNKNSHLLYHIMWRNSKEDVLAQLNVAPPTVINHFLTFSPIENYFYQRVYKECQVLFHTQTALVHDLDIELKKLDRRLLNMVLHPLLQLRQACTHPQVVGGKFKQFKRTMTMDELLEVMVKKVQADIDIVVRSLVSSMNGQAGLHILLGDFDEALRIYKSVLEIPNRYPEGVIKIDSLQKIHTLYNLASLREHIDLLSNATEDFTRYSEEASSLEIEYLRKSQVLVQKEQDTLEKLSATVARLSDNKGIRYSQWWSEVIFSNTSKPLELMERVSCHVFDQSSSKFVIKKTYAHKIKSIVTLVQEIRDWLNNTDVQRKQIFQHLKAIQKISYDVLSQQAQKCHLNPTDPNKKEKDKSNKNLCELCNLKTKLENYEVSIFEVHKGDNTRKRNSKYLQDSADSVDSTEENEAVRKLRHITLFQIKGEGNWKPGQMERILNVILGYAKQRKCNANLINDGTKQLQICEAVRKEFKSLRALWTHIYDQVAANDELAMAKLRFCFPVLEEGQESHNRKDRESIIVLPDEIRDKVIFLLQEMYDSKNELHKSIGILQYLINLQKSPNTERDPCPICREVIIEKWSVLQCGHCYCFDCIPKLMNISISNSVECAVCRKKTSKLNVAFVDCTSRVSTNEIKVSGSHSTKVEAVIIECLEIKRRAPLEKILIFSTWDKMLDLIGEAFLANEISFKRLSSNKLKSKKSLEEFKTIEDVTALLLPLQKGCKGLNLVEATHVFFVEPILNPADEAQAVGRVHRIGQTKPTFVHRFIVSNTIEEKMLSTLDNETTREVTVRHLLELFNAPSVATEPERYLSHESG